MSSPEQRVFRSRQIECPAKQPRLLHQISPSTSMVSSVNTDNNLDYQMVPEGFFSPLDSGPFRCHDCPLPQNNGCKTSGIIYENITLNQVPIPEIPLAKSFPPMITVEPNPIVKSPVTPLIPEKKEVILTVAPNNNTPPKQEVQQTHRSIEEMEKQLKEWQKEWEKDNSPIEPPDPEWLKTINIHF